jgi:hypothetical protein
MSAGITPQVSGDHFDQPLSINVIDERQTHRLFCRQQCAASA